MAEWSTLMTASGVLIAALVSLWNATQIARVKHLTNSMKDELVAVARAAARAEGVLQGRAQMEDEQRGRRS